LSDDEAAAIAAIFRKDAAKPKKEAINPAGNEVDDTERRPIMDSVESDDIGGRVAKSQKGPPAAETQPSKKAARVHVVRSGETLSGIAKEYYGDASLWPLILEANRETLKSPDELDVGAKLVVPVVAKKPDKVSDERD
jgi:nucleoid-associated protein YgaU